MKSNAYKCLRCGGMWSHPNDPDCKAHERKCFDSWMAGSELRRVKDEQKLTHWVVGILFVFLILAIGAQH